MTTNNKPPVYFSSNSKAPTQTHHVSSSRPPLPHHHATTKPKPSPNPNPPPPPPPSLGPGSGRPSFLSVALRRAGGQPPPAAAAAAAAAPSPAAAFDVAQLPPPPVGELHTRSRRVVFPSSLGEMSGDDQVLVFGSFTEAETKSLNGQHNANKPQELSEIQFGTLNFSALSLPKTTSSVTQGTVYPAKLIAGQEKIIAKDNACSNKKETASSTLPNGKPVMFNGFPTANANVSPNNGFIENNQKAGAALPPSMHTKNVNSSAPLPVPAADHSLVPDLTENGGPAHTTSVAAPVADQVDEVLTSVNTKDFQNKPLLPHGLRNTGNICFLNASLQALISCLPFVQLLQNLRRQNIPKVGYPTLSAFVEFISQFDVHDDSNMKKNEKFATVSAKSINPAMFDTVLRNFTPDVPAGTSARPSAVQCSDLGCTPPEQPFGC
uniref:Peptidase C19 ubiquitin carboxyl-terminal hydrolase domain-containing protein n=1 Tax=Leersia perrieri TaxID=77586 RepID=A0A0D9X2I0_9ORYZ